MKRGLLLFLAACCPPEPVKTATITQPSQPPAVAAKELATPEEKHLGNLRQITFGGDNAEAYWSFAGDRLVFQTNHAPYKCDQIEEMSSNGGPSKLVSTGKGRTTCAYFLKGDREILYASTHEASPECPKPPDMSKGYYWGLFEYDIYRADADGSNLRKLTGEPGYDAEATVCPVDGSIVFTSMRSGDLELWRMDADGKNLRQLTSTPGYDGGAFFSPDCSKIVWRASRPTGKDLEEYKALLEQKLVKPTKMDLWVANADGTEAHQVTYLPGASFGPYFIPEGTPSAGRPDGKRIIFASNYLAPRGPEFDLFAIDSDGSHLERITYAGGFDGFPVFSPDGKRLSFSSNRRDVIKKPEGDVYRVTGGKAGEHDTNMFLADWQAGGTPTYQPETAGADRYRKDIDYLAADEREGRGIGSKGLRDAQDYVEAALKAAGAVTSRQPFEITTAIKRGPGTQVEIAGKALAPEDFTPTSYSAPTKLDAAVVATGWGTTDDDYKGKAMKGKIALVHRFAPADAKDATRLSDIRYKAFLAKQHGAVGLIVVDDGDLKQDEAPLPKLSAAGISEVTSGPDAGIPVVVITRKALGKGVKAAKVAVELQPVKTTTDNVIGVIKAGAAAKQPGIVVIGAHLDHLGMGGGGNALDPKVNAVHNGADDNASGVAALLEVARSLDPSKLQRDVYLVAFSGEEEGDLGSSYYVKHPPTSEPIIAMINMDMVGRMRGNQLHVNGGESAKEWHELVEPSCAAARVQCTITGSGYGPSDHMAFYIAGVPVLFLFTGNHLDYHTATDDAEKINAIGGARVAMIAADVTMKVASRTGQLTYVKAPPEPFAVGDVRRRGASLGTIPSYTEDQNAPPGLVLSDTVPDGPAAKAGLRGGDRIVQVGTVEIRNINDFMFVLERAQPGEETKVTFVRDGKRETVTAKFGVPRSQR